jgi:DNA invertase Pin-like site-specific DNA recombinase
MVRIACYQRVSTDDQSLERQRESTRQYVRNRWDVDYDDVLNYSDKSTGTDISRNGYRELMEDVEAGDLDAVVCHSVSRVSRSIRDLDQIVETIVEDNATELHIISEGFQICPEDDDPYQRAMLQLLGVFAELEAEMTQQRVREGIRTRMNNEEYHHGPAPLGFEKDDGYLIETSEFDRVRAILGKVKAGELSKRKAAQELDTSRKSIYRALEKEELYTMSETIQHSTRGGDR